MVKQLTVRDILAAQEVYLYDGGILYVIDDDDEAYGFTQGSKEWFHKTNFWDYFETSSMLSYITIITKEEAVQMYEGWMAKHVDGAK